MKPGIVSAVRTPEPIWWPHFRGSIGAERIGGRMRRAVRRAVMVGMVEWFVVDVGFEDLGVLLFERRLMIWLLW